jgi:pyroglutamyl-peptidase
MITAFQYISIDLRKGLYFDGRRSLSREYSLSNCYRCLDRLRVKCDFIYYCSMAESLRSMEPPEDEASSKSQLKIPGPFGRPKIDNNRVFFLHCPPENLPHTTAEVTEAIQRIVVWLGSQRLAERR